MHMWGKFNGCYIGIARVWSSVVEEQHVSEWLDIAQGGHQRNHQLWLALYSLHKATCFGWCSVSIIDGSTCKCSDSL